MSLPALSRPDRLLWSIVLLTAVLVALLSWLVLPPEKTGGFARQPSTFFNAGYGTKAAYLALDRLGYAVARLRRPLSEETLAGIGALFILKPSQRLQRHEMVQLEDWVKRGHVLVVVPGSSLADAFAGGRRSPSNEPEEGRQPHRELGSCFEDWFSLTGVAADDEESAQSASKHAPSATAKIDANEPICAGIRQLEAGSPRRFAKSALTGPLAGSAAQAFWTDDLGDIGLRIRLGDGAIIAMADAYPWSNSGIGEADNGLMLGNLVREFTHVSPGKVAFDEYHLGFVERDWSPVAMMKLVLAGPWRWAMVQAAVVGLLALYAGAVRFGSPRDVTRRPRRQHREFAEAAGRLYNEAGATALAAATLHRYYRECLCRALRLDPEADNAQISQAVRARSGQEIAAILDQASAAASNPLRRQELLAITQRLHHAVETLDHGP